MKEQKAYIKKVKQIDLTARSKKVELGLIDDFYYSFDEIQDETGRLSYSVEEWFDEKFDAAIEASSELRAVYLDNSESFIGSDDVLGDMDILDQLQASADEIGVPVEDLYDNFHEHKEAIEYVDYLEDKFDEQVREVENWFG